MRIWHRVFACINLYFLFILASTIVHIFYNSVSSEENIIKKISERIIEFTDTIRPVCLPFRPEDAIDDTDTTEGLFVNTASWVVPIV